MEIEHAHSFLVHPGKHVEQQPLISGTSLPKRGALFRLLADVYGRAPEECDIAVA